MSPSASVAPRRFRLLAALAIIAAAALQATGVAAQTTSSGPSLPDQAPVSISATPNEPSASPSIAPAGRIVQNPAQRQASLSLSAAFSGETKPIRAGLVWRVFGDPSQSGQLKLVAKSADAAPTFSLPPGDYIAHAAFGLVGMERRVALKDTQTERFVLKAGALRLGGVIGDVPIPANRLSFSIFVPVGSDSEGRLIASKIKAGELVRLSEGTYHVVSTYGDSNAIMRTDLKVEAGRVTEATVNHHAATVTLKLVTIQGGEAFAGTAFSVLTPGGDVIREAIGSFPTVTLAEGDYVLIARHDGKVYTRDFKVESGLDRDIEVLEKSK